MNVAVIILYNPTIDLLNQLKEMILKNFIQFLLIDNTPDLECDKFVDLSNVIYIPLRVNMGIAYAQNIGLRYINSNFKDVKYVMFLDQDSKFDNLFINKMIDIFEEIQHKNSAIGILTPTIINERDFNVIKDKSSNNYVEVGYSINSGMLSTIDIINKIGYLDEKMFIDYVDFEWCWRAKEKGFRIFRTLDCTLIHNVGESDKFLFKYHYILSSPIRYYYQYRNFIYLICKNYVPINWKINNMIKKMVFIIIIPLRERNILYLKYMFKGLKDGFLRK